jgi:hypothetical protein
MDRSIVVHDVPRSGVEIRDGASSVVKRDKRDPSSTGPGSEALVDAARAVGPIKDEDHEWERRAKAQRIVRARQAIAKPRGAVDAFIALEDGLPSRLRDATAIGERFSKAVAMRRRSNRCVSRAGRA